MIAIFRDLFVNQGLSEYYTDADISSPATNALCTSLKEEELVPMVYSKWPSYQQEN